jgi:hypothetical protein
MKCTKNDFLNIYTKSNVKNLQAKVDGDFSRLNNYTPNIDFLDNIWESYIDSGCDSFNAILSDLKIELKNFKINSDSHELQLEKIDFLDRLKFECNCSKGTVDIKTTKLIKQVIFDTSSIPASGATREFQIVGDNDAVFSVYISNEDSPKKYYNFETKSFTTTRYVLEDIVINEQSQSIFVDFPKVTDDDHYDITIFANPEFNTKHAPYSEARYNDKDRTVNLNASTGSNSSLLHKKLYQYTDNTITLSAISPTAISALTGYAITTDTFSATKHGAGFKVPFTVVLTANANKAYRIIKQPTEKQIGSVIQRTIGSAALPIPGEDVSSSTYYRWPIDNVQGLKKGMRISGTNVTANSIIADYTDTIDIDIFSSSESTSIRTGMIERNGTKELRQQLSSLEGESKSISKYGNETIVDSNKRALKTRVRSQKNAVGLDRQVNGIETTGDPVFTNGIFTSQPGNIVFNKKQADALKDDTIKILANGADEIKSLTGYEFKVSNIKAELTKPTTTTTAASIGTTVNVADVEGVINNVSRLSGIGIDPSTSGPLITSGGGADGAGAWTVDASQPLESGITLTVEGTGRVVTITGDIEFSKIGESDVTIYFDIEQFLAAS